MRFPSLLAVLALAAGTAAAAVAEEPWRALEEPGLRQALAGALLRDAGGREYRFLRDGVVRAGSANGRWTIQRDEVCVATAGARASAGECYEVQQRARQLRFLQDGYVMKQGTAGAQKRRP
jgi:hypothetical protein